jgi:hypothetical protein
MKYAKMIIVFPIQNFPLILTTNYFVFCSTIPHENMGAMFIETNLSRSFFIFQWECHFI